MDISIILFDAGSVKMIHPSDTDELLQYKDGPKIAWINIAGPKDIVSIKQIGDFYGIHQLTVEDILNTVQQPKMEIFENYRYLSIKSIQRELNFHNKQEKKKPFSPRLEQEDKPDEFTIDQVSIIITQNTVITFQEISGFSFAGLQKKILNEREEMRIKDTDYLAYEIINAVIDDYTSTLIHLEEDIENFEDRAAKTSDETFLGEIQDTKKHLLRIRRAILPSRDNITAIMRHDEFFHTNELKPFLQDLSEHLNYAIFTVENHREWLTNIMEVNISVLSYQMNKVMKVLATISTIFIPLTFIAGIYGMNFEFMPELGLKYGYPLVLCCMGIISLVMVIFFKIRRWF